MQLALTYGMGTEAVADITKLPIAEAEEVVESFKANLPGVMKFEADLKNFAKTNGYVLTVYGTKCRFPNYALPPITVRTHQGGRVDRDIENHILKALNNVWRYDEKNALIKQLAMQYDVKIYDNKNKIQEDETRILNAVIQGRHSTALIY